jgi:hypothetical protein
VGAATPSRSATTKTAIGVLINVGWPERKQWWRNLKDVAQVEMRIQGTRRTGQASARGDERIGVTVEVQLD